MDIAILGTGIDALLAAHAVSNMGHTPVIFGDEDSPKEESFDIKFLRSDIPGITDDITPSIIKVSPNCIYIPDSEFIFDFTANYTRKVFGDKDFESYAAEFPLSEFRDFLSLQLEGQQYIDGWKPSTIWSKLWDMYEGYVNYQWVTPGWYRAAKVREKFDLVINTLSMPAWCKAQTSTGHHIFKCSYYWMDDEPPFGPLHCGTILLDHTEEHAHYLQANLWGEWIVHWPETNKPPTAAKRTTRPLGTNCDCAESKLGFINVGSYATWDHRAYLHHSYYKILELLEDMEKQPRQLELM